MIKEFYSVKELADMLGISRIAVFKKVQSGEITAQKIGRSYLIKAADLPHILGRELSEDQKDEIAAAVKRIINEYGETLRLLGRE